jgi:hypothetical protein
MLILQDVTQGITMGENRVKGTGNCSYIATPPSFPWICNYFKRKTLKYTPYSYTTASTHTTQN